MTGPELQAAREATGISQAAIARALGCYQSAVWRLESRRTVRAATVERYLATLDALVAEQLAIREADLVAAIAEGYRQLEMVRSAS